MTKLTKPIAPLAAAAAVLLIGTALFAAQPLAAQTTDTVRSVRIAIVDPSSGDELAVLDPDQEITLAPGEQVLVRTFEPVTTRRADRRPLAATFGFGPTPTALEVVNNSPERGEALIRLNDATPGQRLHIGYKLADRLKLANSGMQLGRILVRVAAPGSTSVTGASSSAWTNTNQFSRPADAVVAALYRGILLREPDSGAAGAIDDLARHGYDAVRRVAANIANSEESRTRMYDNGVSNVRRLEALYGHLLGWSRADAGRERWESDLAEIDRGNIAGVVDAIVRSQQFRSRFGI
ncbi:MAG TPA: phycobilisome rod-core linker polypeptide [Thermoanaerobaculia bacterium]|jgi:hypothetical protein|nr:phycobilisome rod-core linker polypeptide [Thermoanaerobaculia bacterium]